MISATTPMVPGTEQFERALIAELRSALHERLGFRVLPVSWHDVNAVPTIVERMLAVLPDPVVADLDDRLGPFYDTAGLVAWLGVSRQAIHKQRTTRYLALRTGDGDLLYPSFQFEANGAVLAGLPAVLGTLRPVLNDPWNLALWVTTPVDELDGSVVTALRNGRQRAALDFAAREAARLAA